MRNIWVLGFGATYIRDFTVFHHIFFLLYFFKSQISNHSKFGKYAIQHSSTAVSRARAMIPKAPFPHSIWTPGGINELS